MKTISKVAGLVLFCFIVGLSLWVWVHKADIPILNPQGIIALQERNLMIKATLIMLIVVVPVFVLAIFIGWKYREGNAKAKYMPEWDHNKALEFIWWGVPLAIVAWLGVIAWQSSHALDPFKPLDSTVPPITIQVVALDWKWLFIYPEQQIATVNFVEFPDQTPVHFEITADAPMNSFWIPALSGQIYAMPGMSTQLYMMADHDGSYYGASANVSGKGFAGMHFMAQSVSAAAFSNWVQTVKQTPAILSQAEYQNLAAPSENNPVSFYSSAATDLYNHIMMKFMVPQSSAQPMSTAMPMNVPMMMGGTMIMNH